MAMTPEQLQQWQAADAAFETWLELDEAQRDAWLAAQDLTEPVLSRVLRMIEAHVKPNLALDPLCEELAGCQLGDWVLERELGRGGMAVVWLAHRQQPTARQQAAVKIMTLAALGAAGRDRFQRETEILARLNHPNIPPLIDCGMAADGTFWMAMPLIEGERIDNYCDRHDLDARAIVKLGLQVCDAVACAHRNLVVHRDLKPSNVLVEDGGHVRLLDFGIAQFTDSQDDPTRTMWRALTPGYAAPEQLLGAPPSTAIDIYGLGALLHRLLTGQVPSAATASGAGTRPSLLVRQAGHGYHRNYAPLKNDLDRVLLKALAEDPAQRYASVDAMADDLRRWLAGMPVLAQKPKLGYRLRKFAGRHKTGVAAAALVLLTLAGGIGATLWQAGEARAHAAQAQHQAALAREEAGKAYARVARAEKVRDFLGDMFLAARGSDGQEPSVVDLLQTFSGGARSQKLADDPLTAADVLMLTGTVRFSYEDYDASLADLETALELLTPHADIAPAELSRLHWELARHARRNGDYQAVARHARESDAFNQRWDAPENERFRSRMMLGDALLSLDPEAAVPHLRSLLADIQASELKETYIHLHAINGLLWTFRTAAERLPLEEERIRIARAFYGPGTAGLSFSLGEATHTLRELGMLDRAEALSRESMAAADQSTQRPKLMRGMARCYLGLVQQQRGLHAQALEVLREGNGMMTQQDDSRAAVARCLSAQAYAEAALGNDAQALATLDHSDKLLRSAGEPGQKGIVINCGLRTSLLLRRGRLDADSHDTTACAPANADSIPLAWQQASAERSRMAGDHQAAGRVLADLRKAYPPKENHREWMRPWMLSALLAHETGDHEAGQRMLAELGEHASLAPVSTCVAAPDAASCLGFP